ncbi:MAG: hypothetical protein ABEH80_00360 [Halobaculum sp.]
MTALPSTLEPLVWPYRRLGGRAAVLAVLVTAVVCAGATVVAADAVAASVTGTTTVDNPQRPPDWACEDDDGSTVEAFDPCAAPAEIEVDRSRHAATAVRQLLPETLLAVGGVWLLFTGLLVGGGRVRTVATRTAWTVPPLTLPAAARAYTATTRAPTVSWSTDLDSLAAEARVVAFGDGVTLVTVAGLLGLVWSGLVLYGAARDTDAVWWGPLAAVTGPAILGLGSVLGAPTPGTLGAGLVLAVMGLPFALAPARVASLSARTELIGYRNTSDVEPKSWYVTLNRLFGLAFVTAGVLLAQLPTYLL